MEDLLDELERLRNGRGVHGSALVGGEIHGALVGIADLLGEHLIMREMEVDS